jgi:alpha-ribazole phosphatase
MEIIVIRHTEPDVLSGICYGQTDLDLHSTGIENVAKIATNFAEECEIIYSSPLKRCSLLADALKAKANAMLVVDDRLMEMNFGTWEMKPWNEINEDDLNKWMIDFENEKVPGGESALDLRARVQSFLKDIMKAGFSKIVIVCHAGTMRTFISVIENISLGEAFKRKVEYGSVMRFLI